MNDRIRNPSSADKESGTWSPGSMARNPESSTVLDSLICVGSIFAAFSVHCSKEERGLISRTAAGNRAYYMGRNWGKLCGAPDQRPVHYHTHWLTSSTLIRFVSIMVGNMKKAQCSSNFVAKNDAAPKFNAKSTRKLRNFNFQWTKTLYQNNLKNIAFFFYIFQELQI